MINSEISAIERYLGLSVVSGSYDSRLAEIERYLKLTVGKGQYRARIDEINRVIDLPIYIIEQPPSDIYYSAGDTVVISVKAIGKNVAYQWQYLSSQGVWTNSTASSASTANFTFSYNTSYNGRDYRCKLTSGTTTVTSDECTIHTAT